MVAVFILSALVSSVFTDARVFFFIPPLRFDFDLGSPESSGVMVEDFYRPGNGRIVEQGLRPSVQQVCDAQV